MPPTSSCLRHHWQIDICYVFLFYFKQKSKMKRRTNQSHGSRMMTAAQQLNQGQQQNPLQQKSNVLLKSPHSSSEHNPLRSLPLGSSNLPHDDDLEFHSESEENIEPSQPQKSKRARSVSTSTKEKKKRKTNSTTYVFTNEKRSTGNLYSKEAFQYNLKLTTRSSDGFDFVYFCFSSFS
jgi:hypothetical protein